MGVKGMCGSLGRGWGAAPEQRVWDGRDEHSWNGEGEHSWNWGWWAEMEWEGEHSWNEGVSTAGMGVSTAGVGGRKAHQRQCR